MAQPSPPNQAAPPPNGQAQTPQPTALLWEGDRVFNVYIHDYLVKRGFRKAAEELVVEADIGDALPPINARQSFLFEWWTVFWMFFSAKSTGQGLSDAMSYFQRIQDNQAEGNRAAGSDRAAGLPVTNQPMPSPSGLQQQPIRPGIPPPPQPPSNSVRPPNSPNDALMPPKLPIGGQNIQYPIGGMPHGTMSAGRPPSAPAQLDVVIDPNTLHNPQRPPSQQQNNRPVGPQDPLPLQQSSHPEPSVPHLQAAPGQVSHGQHDVMRPPGQFPSPTMAHAHPQNTPPLGPMTHPHMGMGAPMMMGGPSGQHIPQHMGRHVPPSGNQPNAPTQPFPLIVNPGGTVGPSQGTGSRTPTPSGSVLAYRSPALAQQQQQPPHGGLPPPLTPLIPSVSDMEQNLLRIPPIFLAQMKQEAGVGGREIRNLSYEEKCRLYDLFRRTMQKYNGATSPAPPRPTTPPSHPDAKL